MKQTSVIPKPITEYDLRLLRIFKVVVENGGFAAAENELGVTRSTISIHISNLETRLKLKLCLRGRAGFSLTEDGQVIYQAVIELFSSLDDFSLLASSLSSDLSGELVILCSDLFNQQLQQKLAQVIRYINDEAPDLHITLDGDSIANIEKSLLNDKAHIGLYPAYREADAFRYQQIYNEAVYLCCHEQHPFYHQVDSQITEAMLAEANSIHPGIDIDADGREQLKKLKLAAKAYQYDTRKSMVMSGQYLAFLPQSYIQKELNTGVFRLIKPDELNYQFTLSLVQKVQPREQRKVALLKRAFERAFKDVKSSQKNKIER